MNTKNTDPRTRQSTPTNAGAPACCAPAGNQPCCDPDQSADCCRPGTGAACCEQTEAPRARSCC
jgi:hypothetical protein